MKKILLIVFAITIFSAVPAFAAHLESNPEACDYYVVSGLPSTFTAAQNVPGDPTGKTGLDLDLSGLPAVTADTQFTVTAVCCRAQTATQTGGCSDASTPFVFTQTATPAAPSGEKVAP